MQSSTDYLRKTESAVRVLFSGIESYLSILQRATGIIFVSGESSGPKQDAEFAAWRLENVKRLEAARLAHDEFMAESFALDTLCGSLLQVAEKGLEVFGRNTLLPQGLPATIKAKHARFCVGRVVRSVPLGLVIYAARNQHTHFNDNELREPSLSIFDRLATAHGYGDDQRIVDPAFDLSNQSLLSYASNVTSLIEWRSYDRYFEDMCLMLDA